MRPTSFFVRGQNYSIADLGSSDRIDYVALTIWILSTAIGFLASQGIIRATTIPGLVAEGPYCGR
jgi:hypothetical protein